MKKFLYAIFFTTILYANACPKYLTIDSLAGITAVFPIYNKNITKPDMDCDGIIDTNDTDIDGDGVNNNEDAFPRNKYEAYDIDNDGIGDNADQHDNRLDKNKLIVYDDVDKIRGRWTGPAGVPVRVYSFPRGTGVAKIEGNKLYKLKLNNIQNNVIQWDIRTKRRCSIYVKLKVKTKLNGKMITTYRIMHYYPGNASIGLTNKGYIHIGTGDFDYRAWQTIRRDLLKDLHDYDPRSLLIGVEEFWIRGESYLDNIEMLDYRLYEDGTSPQHWHIYGDTKKGYCLSVYDKHRRGSVVKLQGNNQKTAYVLNAFYDTKINKTIQWSMKYSEDFTVYVKVITRNGVRYLAYKNQDYNKRSKENPAYMYFGLGKSMVKSGWHTITRDLNEDLRKYEPKNYVTKVIYFSIRGSGYIDDISLLRSPRAEDDPIFSHKHYAMGISGISTEIYSTVYDIYVNGLSERHSAEATSNDAIVLNYKKMNDTVWKNKILIRGNRGNRLGDPNICRHPHNLDKIVLRYNIRHDFNSRAYASFQICIVDLKNNALNRTLSIKNIPTSITLNGNTLFTPTGKILLSGYGGDGGMKIFRSLEAFDDDRVDYHMEEIASFKKEGEIFLEPVLSYAFDKLIVSIRKDIAWFNGRDGQIELYKNTKGELRYIDDLEGGNLNTVWHKKVLDAEIHGMSIPPYQGNNFLMWASNGENRQYVMSIKSSDYYLNNFNYNKKAFYIKHPRGGGYPASIKNENEYIVLYWEETSDLRKTKITIKDLYAD